MGDLYMRFFTDRGQVVSKAGTEDLSAFSANLIAHYKMNDNVAGTGTTLVLDAVGSFNGTASTVTSSLSTTAIVSTGFNFAGVYHVSVADNIAFTRTASTQPLTVALWAYYENNGASQVLFSKPGEYELSINSSDELVYSATSGNTDTVLLLHADGTDASTTFTDSSTNAKTITANGNAQIDTAQKKFGTASYLGDGTGDYVSVSDSADFNFGTGDFTVDYWVRFSAVEYKWQFMWGTDSTGISVSLQSGTTFWVYRVENTSYVTSTAPLADTWYHVALIRTSGTVRFFVNGTQLGTDATNTATLDMNTYSKFIGTYVTDPTTYSLNGWIDEFRVVKGTAAWTTNFTPPDTPYAGSATNTWTADTNISEGWNFLATVFKGVGTLAADLKIYINGVIDSNTFASDAAFTAMSNTTSPFRIGTNSSAGANNWYKKMDNLAFIHQELSAANIASLYSTSPYQITTVFTESEVFGVQYTQLNDIVWLTHENHPPQKLIRTSAAEWSIGNAPILGGPFLDNNTPATTSAGTSASTITLTVSATTGTVNLTVSPTNASLFTLSASTLGHHGTYWMLSGLAQTNATTGLQEVGYVRITHVINSYTATATVIKNIKLLANTVWAEGAWSSIRGYPSCVTLQERRLWFGRTNYEPQKEWGSKSFQYENFALDSQDDDDALNLSLASNESNEIQWLSPGKSLVAGTFGGAFITNSGSSEPITPTNVNASEEVGFGASSILPKKIGSFLYYVQRFGKKMREMFFNWELDTYKAADRTILSPHILGDGVSDMDVQQHPETILYCVLTNGTLATLSREVDQEVVGWARHSTAGTYTSVACIPSQSANYDEAWVIVERWIGGNQRKYVEFFENIEVPTRQELCLYLHSALTYSAYESTSTSNATISLSASSGSVTLTSSTAYFNGGMISKRLRAINASGTTLGEGTITATGSTTSITLSITTTFNALSYAPGFWGTSVATVSGLDHLAAKTVGILADGITESLTRTIASGAVTLGSNYFIVSVGLSYDQKLFTLPKEAATNRGTAQGKFQRYNEISFKVNRSTQVFKYGIDADNLDDINVSFTPTVTTLYTGILPPQGGGVSMRGGYKRGAQIYVKNSNPLPIEILSIMGALDTEDK